MTLSKQSAAAAGSVVGQTEAASVFKQLFYKKRPAKPHQLQNFIPDQAWRTAVANRQSTQWHQHFFLAQMDKKWRQRKLIPLPPSGSFVTTGKSWSASPKMIGKCRLYPNRFWLFFRHCFMSLSKYRPTASTTKCGDRGHKSTVSSANTMAVMGWAGVPRFINATGAPRSKSEKTPPPWPASAAGIHPHRPWRRYRSWWNGTVRLLSFAVPFRDYDGNRFTFILKWWDGWSHVLSGWEGFKTDMPGVKIVAYRVFGY